MAQTVNFATSDTAEAMAAFVEKTRPPLHRHDPRPLASRHTSLVR